MQTPTRASTSDDTGREGERTEGDFHEVFASLSFSLCLVMKDKGTKGDSLEIMR
jgi:hypothetical protein